MGRDQKTNGSSSPATTAAATTKSRNDTAATQKKDSLDSNLRTLLEFKKDLLIEQKNAEKKIQEINNDIESTKKNIDDQRIELQQLRTKLKGVNEEKDSEFTKFMEMKNSLAEARSQMKTLEEKAGSAAASKLRKERYDIAVLSKNLDQIEHDIQTKKLSKDQERKLVARSKEIATKLHTLNVIYKKEDRFRTISSQYGILKSKMNKIFDKKSEFGNKIGELKSNIDNLLNLRESLYEERRNVIHTIREAEAKLEMVETQLNAIQFRKSRSAAEEQRHRRQRGGQYEPRGESRYEALQERSRRSKENQERWNTLKDAALKKMSSGEKLTFDEMKLIFGDSNTG
ncbi:MAG: hypothetical protein WA393_13290 [Nitrososphaeraceae archaeon]